MNMKFFMIASGLFVSSCNSQPVETNVDSCTEDMTVGTTLKSGFQIPCDYHGTVSREGLYRFAWNTFFAINWPAEAQTNSGSTRGEVDTNARYGAVGETPVWDTWRGKRELFRISIDKNKTLSWDTSSPGQFRAYPLSADPNPDIQACPGVLETAGLGIMNSSKIDNYNDETDEIGLAVLWQIETPDSASGSAPSLPNDSNLVRYQVKFNQNHWDYVVDRGIYATDPLNKLIMDTTESKLGGVSFPASSNESKQTGSILTKSAWKMLSAKTPSLDNYYTVDAYYYKSLGDNEVCYQTAKFGLIALHVIRKTEKFNTFFFSTFEHKENYPGAFYYANTVAGSPPSSILPSGYNITYENPESPVTGIPNDQAAYQATRLVPPSDALITVNREADGVNENTIWSNYRLVGVQYKPVDGKNGSIDPDTNQDFFLANPVVETNQRFQYFDGKFTAANVNNVAVTPRESKDGTVNMGGCMGCHGAGAQLSGTDFSFTLGNVTAAPMEIAAETLADKCGELNSTLQDEACVPE